MSVFFDTTIKVPVETLLSKAEQLTEYAEENESILDTIENILSEMESSGEWTGKSMTAALKSVQKHKEKHAEAVNDLYSLANFLRNFAQEMEAKDEELKMRATGI